MIKRLVNRVRRSYKELNAVNISSDIKDEIFSEILANESAIIENPIESCQLFKYLFFNNHKNTPLIEFVANKTLNEEYKIYKLLINSISTFIEQKNGLFENKFSRYLYNLGTHFSQNHFIPLEILNALTKYYKQNANDISKYCLDVANNATASEIIDCSVNLSLCGLGNSFLLEKIVNSIDNSKWILSFSEKIRAAYTLSTAYTNTSYFGNNFTWIGGKSVAKILFENPIKNLITLNDPRLISSKNAVSLLPIFAHLKHKSGDLDVLGQILLERSVNLSLWNVIHTIKALHTLDCRFSSLLTKLTNICLDQMGTLPTEILARIAIQLHDLREPSNLLVQQVSMKMGEIIAADTHDVELIRDLKSLFSDFGIKNLELERFEKFNLKIDTI